MVQSTYPSNAGKSPRGKTTATVAESQSAGDAGGGHYSLVGFVNKKGVGIRDKWKWILV